MEDCALRWVFVTLAICNFLAQDSILFSSKTDRKKQTGQERRWSYIRSLGLVSLLLAIAGIVMPFSFTGAVIVIYAAYAIGLALIYFQRTVPLVFRVIATLAFTGGIGVFTCLVVVYDNPVEVSGSWYVANYALGAAVNRFKWQEGMSESRLNIRNPSYRDYSDVDIHFLTSDFVVGISQTSGLPCREIEEDVTPPRDTLGTIFHSMGRTGSRRVWCDKLPAKSTVQLFIPVGNVDEFVKNHFVPPAGKNAHSASGMIFGEKRKPVVEVHVYYKALFKPSLKIELVRLSE